MVKLSSGMGLREVSQAWSLLSIRWNPEAGARERLTIDRLSRSGRRSRRHRPDTRSLTQDKDKNKWGKDMSPELIYDIIPASCMLSEVSLALSLPRATSMDATFRYGCRPPRSPSVSA